MNAEEPGQFKLRGRFAIARLLGVALTVAVVGGLVWFDVNGRGIRAWLDPQPILSVATLIIGIMMLGWQLATQHQNTVAANRRQAQDRLKLDIYGEIAKRIEATSAPLTNLALTPTAFVGELAIRGIRPSRYHFSDLQVVSQEASNAISALGSVLELYEIVMPEFAVFRRRLRESFQGARVGFGDFLNLALPILAWPSQGVPALPTEADTEELSRLARITQAEAVTVSAIISDLRRAAQNYLLGGLFPGRHVPERTPTDPSFAVTRLPEEKSTDS